MRIAKLLIVPLLLLGIVLLWKRLGDDATVDVAPPVERPDNPQTQFAGN